jgi:hypothetical protein
VGFDGTPEVFFRAEKTDSDQTLNDDTETTVTFNNEVYDQGGIWVPNNFNVPNDGLYLLETTVVLTFAAAGYCRVWFDLGGVGPTAEDRRIVTAGPQVQVFNLSSLVHLAQAQIVQVRAHQVTSVGALINTGITRFNGAQLRIGALPGGP